MSKIDTIIAGIQQRYAKASGTNAEKYQSNPNNQVNTFRSNEEVLAYYASKAQEEFGLNSYDQQVAQAKQNLAQQAAVQAGQNKQLLENYQNSQRTVELPPEQEMIENASFIDKVNDSAIGLLKGTNNLVQMGLSVGDVLYNHSPVAGVNRVLDGKPYFSDKFSEGDVTQFAKSYLGIDPKGENEMLDRGYSTAYRQEADALHKAINDADGLLGKSIAGFKQGFDSPSLVLSTIAESAPELFIGGGAGAGLKALGLGGKTANAVGQGTAAYLGETARTALQSDDGSITHRENLINAGIGIATGGVARVMSNSVTPEGMFSGLNAAQRPTIKQGASSIALAPVSAGKEFGKEGVSEYTEELVQGIGQQYRETGAVDLGEATGQAGFGAFVGSAIATPSASALLLNNTLEGAGLTSRAITNQKIENKTNPEHKKYDPAFAYQKAEMDSKSGTLDTQAASEAQLTAMETALNKLDEFDTQLASMPNGKEKDKLKKQRDQWFDTQVKPLQEVSTSTGGVNQWGLSDDMDGDTITNTIINYSQIHYQLGQERLAQQAKAYEEASKPIEIPQYTNVGGTEVPTQQATTAQTITTNFNGVQESGASLRKRARAFAKSAAAYSGGDAQDGTYAAIVNANSILGKDFRYVSSIRDTGAHRKPFSRHNKGLAFDLTVHNGVNVQGAIDRLESHFKSLGFTVSPKERGSNSDITIMNEYKNPVPWATGGHLHISFRTTDIAAEYYRRQRGAGTYQVTTTQPVQQTKQQPVQQQTTGARAPSGSGTAFYIGDSIAVGAGFNAGSKAGNKQKAVTSLDGKRFKVAGDAIGNDQAIGASPPIGILYYINKHAKSLKGQHVVLSTGASNHGNVFKGSLQKGKDGGYTQIEEQLKALKAAGATVTVMGVADNLLIHNKYGKSPAGTGQKFNTQLSELASKYGFEFAGGFTAKRELDNGRENYVHGSNYAIAKNYKSAGAIGSGATTQVTGYGQGATQQNSNPSQSVSISGVKTSWQGNSKWGTIKNDSRWDADMSRIYSKYNFTLAEQQILKAQIGAESNFVNIQKNNAWGAGGLAQFIDATAKEYNINKFDPLQALDGQARLMKYLVKKHGGDWAKALAEYNTGDKNGRVSNDSYWRNTVMTMSWGSKNGKNMGGQTLKYVEKILHNAQSMTLNGQGGAITTSSDTTSSAPVQQATGTDPNAELNKLIQEIEDDEFRTKTAEEQEAMQARITELENKIAEQEANQQAQAQQQAQEPDVEAQATQEAQDTAFKQAVRFSQKLTEDHIVQMVEAGVITQEQATQLREIGAAKQTMNEMRNIQGVRKDIFEGHVGNTAEESHRGLDTYMAALQTALSSNNTRLIEKFYPDLERWQMSHANKAMALTKTLQAVEETGLPHYAARKADSQEWEVFQGTLDPATRKRLAALGMELSADTNYTSVSPKTIDLVNSIQQEAQAITKVQRAYASALGNLGNLNQVDLSGLAQFENNLVQPSIDNVGGMNPTRGTIDPVPTPKSPVVDINMVNAMVTDAVRDNRNLPDPMDYESSEVAVPSTPAVNTVSTDTNPSTGLVRGNFTDANEFNTARNQGQISPNAVWIGRGKIGSSTISLSNFLKSGNNKKDTEDGKTNVNNLMETVEINGESITRIRAGVLGSPIQLIDMSNPNQANKLPQQDRYRVPHDGTTEGKLSAHVESANRYMDMLRVSVANNSNMAKALVDLATNPEAELYSSAMGNSHNFTESKILEQVLPAIAQTLDGHNVSKLGSKWLQNAVSNTLDNMGTMMADGQFHSDIKREVIDGVTNYPALGKYPTTLHTSETLKQWQVSESSNAPTEVPTSEVGVEVNDDVPFELLGNQEQEQNSQVPSNDEIFDADELITNQGQASELITEPVTESGATTTTTTSRNSAVATRMGRAKTKQTSLTGLNKQAIQTAKVKPEVKEEVVEESVPTEYIKGTPIPKARMNKVMSVQEMFADMDSAKPEKEVATKIPDAIKVEQATARGVIEGLTKYNPKMKIEIHSKDKYSSDTDKDSDTIYISEDSKDILGDTVRQMVSKSVASVADEIDALTTDDLASFKDTEDKIKSGELVYEENSEEANNHERKRRVMNLRQELSEISKTTQMSVGKLLRDNPKIKEQYPDVLAKLTLATSSSSNLINMGIFDPETKAVLKQIKMKRKNNSLSNVYENLVDVISRFFGKDPKEYTAYSRLIEAVREAAAIQAGEYTSSFLQTNTAKLSVFQGVTKESALQGLSKRLFPKKGEDNPDLRQVIQTHFKQQQSDKKPLSIIPDFLLNVSQDFEGAWKALGFETAPTEAQEKQVMDFIAFHQSFVPYLEQAVQIKENKNYLYQDYANHFITHEDGTVTIEPVVATALSYVAYDYMMSKGNHKRNTDKEIFELLGIHDSDLQDATYLPHDIREAYQHRGVSALALANSLGSRAAQTLNISRSAYGSDKIESYLHSSFGNWIITAMQGADLVHIQEMKLVEHEANIKRLDMNPDSKDEVLEQTSKANSQFSTIRFVSFSNEQGEGRNDLLEEIAEINQGTGSFLADMMGGVSLARYPLTKAPKPDNVKDKIKRTIAKVSKVQALRVGKAQQESMVIEETFYSVMTGLAKDHADAFQQMIGAKVTDEQLASKHDRDHTGMLGKAESIKRDWDNAVSWIESLKPVNDVREYWDTMFMAVNSRMHLNATVMNIQGSKLHRAMADLKNFKVTIKLKSGGKNTLDSLVTKIVDKADKLTAKDLSNEELKVMFFLRAIGENAEGSEDFIETWIKNSKYADTFATGFTVDKLPSYVFIPAFLAYMGQDYMQDAIKAMSKQMNGETLTAREMNHITTAVADMDMGANSLRALMEFTKFDNAQRAGESTMTTSLGLGSDGLNNGAALAHIWNGAHNEELLNRTGFYISESKYRNYFQARHDKSVGDYYTGFVDFLEDALKDGLPKSYITILGNRHAEALKKYEKTQDPEDKKRADELYKKWWRIIFIQGIHPSLFERAVAKAILVPFNYGAGMGALGRSVFNVFMQDVQKVMVKAANKDKEAYQRYLDGEITKEEYEVIREAIIRDNGKEGKEPSLANIMAVLYTLNDDNQINLVVENDPTTDGEKYEVRFDTSINPRVLLHAWFDKKTETAIQKAYDDSMGDAVKSTLRSYEKDYIDAKRVNMELLQANIALFTEVYKQVEAKAIQKVIERDTAKLVADGYSEEDARKIVEKEIQYNGGLLDHDRQALVHSVMDQLQAKIHTAYSAEKNETGSMIQLTGLDSKLTGDSTGLVENAFYVMNDTGILQSFTGNMGVRTLTLEGKALLANSAQTQSMDSYISSYAMALGARININVHDANIGAIDNQIDMINHQNKAAFIALASYNGQLESLKALRTTTQAMLNLHETKEIELDLSQSGATMQALSALYGLAGDVYANEKAKLDMLNEIETVSQYAGELGEYTVTTEDKKLLTASREKLLNTLGVQGDGIKQEVLYLAEKHGIEFVKPVEFVSNPTAITPRYVFTGAKKRIEAFEWLMGNELKLNYDLAEPDDLQKSDNQSAGEAAHQWLKHNVKDYPKKGKDAVYQNNKLKMNYLSVKEADAVYISDAMRQNADGDVYVSYYVKDIIDLAHKLGKPVFVYNQFINEWEGYDRVRKAFTPTHVGLTSQPAIFEGGGMNADAIMALMGDEVVENAQVQQEPQWGKEVATGQARDGIGEVTYIQYEKGDTTFFVFSNGTVRQIPTKYIGKNISIHSDAFKELIGLYANTDFTKTLLEKQLQLLKYSAHDVYVQFIGTDTSNLSYERLTYLEDEHPIAWSNNSVNSNTIGFNLLHPRNVYYGEVVVHELHHAYTISAITNTTGAPHRDAANNSYFSEVLRLIDQITYAMYHSRVVQSDPYLLESVDYMGTNFHELMTVASSQEPVYELLRKIPASYVMEYSPFTAYAHKELGVPLQANNLAEVIDILSMELASRELSKTKLAKLPEDQGIKNQLKQLTKQQKGNNLDLLRSRTESITRNGADYYFQHSESNAPIRRREEDASQESPNSNNGGNAEDMEGVSSGGLSLPTITNLTELQSYISGLTNAHAFTKSLNKYLMDAVKDFNPKVKIDVSEVTEGYAKYDLSNNVITLDPVIHDPTAADGAKLKLINHELLHALTEVSIQSGNPKYAKGIDHLYQMMDQVLQAWQGNTNNAELNSILNIIKDLPREQALSEFVAYGMTEPAMAKFIDNTLKPENIKGLTLSKRVSKVFDYFIAAVYSALGLKKTGYKTFAQTVHDLMDSFTDLPITPIQAVYSQSAMKSVQENIKRGRETINGTESNDTTRFSQVFDETQKLSAADMFRKLKGEGITTEWSNHLDLMWSSIYDTHYESLDADMKAVLDEDFDKIFSDVPIFMQDKEAAAYAGVFAVLKHIYAEGNNKHLIAELNKVYEQVVTSFPTAKDYMPDDYQTAQELGDKDYLSYIENKFNNVFKDNSPNAIPKLLALILTSNEFSNKTKAKLKLRELKYDTWFDKLMNIWHRLMNFTRQQFVKADNTSEATQKLVTKLIQVDAATRLRELNLLDKAWDMAYSKPMNLANKAYDKAWQLGANGVMNVAERVVGENKDGKLSKQLTAARQVYDYLGELKNHNMIHDPKFVALAKERGIDTKNLELTHADVAAYGLNNVAEGALAIVGGDKGLTYGGNQKLKSAIRDVLKETINEMLGQRGVGNIIGRIGMFATKISQMRADRKAVVLTMFEGLLQDPKAMTSEVKRAMTQKLIMTDSSSLLKHHSMSDTMDLIFSHSKRQSRSAKLEKQLSKLVKNPEELNHMLMQIKKLGFYMATETTVEDMVKSSEMIATSTSTRWSIPYDQMNQEVYEIVDEMVTLYALDSVHQKYNVLVSGIRDKEAKLIESMLQTHKALVEQSKEDFKDNPLNYNKGYIPALHNPSVDVQAITLDQWEEYRSKGYVMVDENPIQQDELDNSEPRILVINRNYHAARYVTGALEMKDSHHKGFTAYSWQENGRELARVGQERMHRIHERAKTLNAKDYNPADYAGSNLIMVVGTDNLITSYQYEMTGLMRNELLDRNLEFDQVLATMDANLYAKPELKETQRELAKALIADANDPVAGYKRNKTHFTVLHPESTDPRVQEMFRMMPYEFRHEMELAFGKGKPMYIRTSVFNAVFGFRKYSVAELFDKQTGERNILERMIHGLYRKMYGDQAVNQAAMHQRIIEKLVGEAKDYIVIRSGKVLLGNIVANMFMLLAQGLTPREVVNHMFYAWKEGKAYRKLQSELIEAQMELRANPDDKAKVKQLQAKIHGLQRSMEASGMHEYMQVGLMSTIVEDIDMGSETTLFRRQEEAKFDAFAEKVPAPARTAVKWFTMHPDTPLHKMMAEATQFSDFAAKYALAKHTEAKAIKAGKSKAQAFDLGIREAQEAFINYDIPTSRKMQTMNDLGLFMFTKFALRFQKALARQLHSNGGHVIAQHFLVEAITPFAGILNPLVPIPNIGMSAFGLFSGFGMLPWVAIFL